MPNLFNKMRYQLLISGKGFRYFKYATGEIILVVIGILIALQINNWNENRKSIKQGNSLMKELLEEFQLHINTFDYGLEQQIESLELQQKLFKIKDLERLTSDSLIYMLGFANIDINIASNTYTKIKNQGIGKLSKNDSLNKAINYHLMERIEVYNRRIDYYLERLKSREEYVNASNLILRNNLIKGFTEVSEEEIKESVFNFIKTPRSKRIMILSYYDKISAIEFLIRMKKNWIELIQAIQKELSLTETNLEPLANFDNYLDYKIIE